MEMNTLLVVKMVHRAPNFPRIETLSFCASFHSGALIWEQSQCTNLGYVLCTNVFSSCYQIFFIVHMCRVICLTLYLLLYMGFYQNVLSFTCVEKSVRHYICYTWGFIKIFILHMCRVICPTLFFLLYMGYH